MDDVATVIDEIGFLENSKLPEDQERLQELIAGLELVSEPGVANHDAVRTLIHEINQLYEKGEEEAAAQLETQLRAKGSSTLTTTAFLSTPDYRPRSQTMATPVLEQQNSVAGDFAKLLLIVAFVAVLGLTAFPQIRNIFNSTKQNVISELNSDSEGVADDTIGLPPTSIEELTQRSAAIEAVTSKIAANGLLYFVSARDACTSEKDGKLTVSCDSNVGASVYVREVSEDGIGIATQIKQIMAKSKSWTLKSEEFANSEYAPVAANDLKANDNYSIRQAYQSTDKDESFCMVLRYSKFITPDRYNVAWYGDVQQSECQEL